MMDQMDDSEDQVIDEIIEHLRMLDGDSLKRVMEEMQQMQNPVDEPIVTDDATTDAMKVEQPLPDGSIATIAGEQDPLDVPADGMMGDEQEMTDEEIDELLKNL